MLIERRSVLNLYDHLLEQVSTSRGCLVWIASKFKFGGIEIVGWLNNTIRFVWKSREWLAGALSFAIRLQKRLISDCPTQEPANAVSPTFIILVCFQRLLTIIQWRPPKCITRSLRCSFFPASFMCKANVHPNSRTSRWSSNSLRGPWNRSEVSDAFERKIWGLSTTWSKWIVTVEIRILYHRRCLTQRPSLELIRRYNSKALLKDPFKFFPVFSPPNFSIKRMPIMR